MSVLAVPRSIARSREKSLYRPLNMESADPFVAPRRGGLRFSDQWGGATLAKASTRRKRTSSRAYAPSYAETRGAGAAGRGTKAKLRPLLGGGFSAYRWGWGA